MDPNTEPLNIRVPKPLKEQLKVLRRFEMASSVGELVRTVLREHVVKITSKREYQWWLREQERLRLEAKKEKAESI